MNLIKLPYRKKGLLALAIFGTCLTMKANAQHEKVNFDSTYLKDGTYVFDDTLDFPEDDLFTTYKSQFGLGSNDEMRLDQSVDVGETGPNIVGEGHFYSKYQQYHKGFKVEDCHMNVLGQYNIALRASGFIMKGLDVNVDGAIPEEAALDKALAFIGANSYIWQDGDMETELKEDTENPDATNYPKGTLSIRRVQGGNEVSDYKLCWVFSIDATDPVGSYVVVVDAITGEVIETPNGIENAQWSWGNVDTWYNGNQPIETSTCNLCTRYTLYSPPSHRSRGCLYDNSHNTWSDAKDGNNSWSAGETTNRTVASAYWISDITRNYYANKHGRWGSDYNGKEVQLIANVGFLPTGNAGFRPQVTDVNQILMAPDNGHPISTLDIIGHEISHAYIRFHSNVGSNAADYDANAIKEGFADIFGQLVERSFTGNMDWTFGNNCNVFNRYFNSPHSDWPYPSADRYNDAGYWQPATSGSYGWYTNSGILRKWFYRLSTRTTSPAGVGIDVADNIAYYTLNWWIWSNLNWQELARQSVAEAAYDFGQCSKEHKAVMQSWVDVGLWSTPRPCLIIVPHGVDVVHAGNFSPFKISPSFNDEDIPVGGTYSYTIPSSWKAYQSGDDLIVSSLYDNATRKVQVTYTAPGGDKYYGEKVVHVLNGTAAKSNHNISIENENTQMKISPNPASGFIKVELKEAVTNGKINIVDLLGKLVYSETMNGQVTNISLPSLSSGIYFLTIKSDKLTTTKRFEIIAR